MSINFGTHDGKLCHRPVNTSPWILLNFMHNTAFALWFKTECNRFCILIGLRKWFIVNSCYGTHRRPDDDDVMISVFGPTCKYIWLPCYNYIGWNKPSHLFLFYHAQTCHKRNRERKPNQTICIRCGHLMTQFSKLYCVPWPFLRAVNHEIERDHDNSFSSVEQI